MTLDLPLMPIFCMRRSSLAVLSIFLVCFLKRIHAAAWCTSITVAWKSKCLSLWVVLGVTEHLYQLWELSKVAFINYPASPVYHQAPELLKAAQMKVIFFNQLPQPALTADHNIRLTLEHPLLFVHEYSTKQNSNFNSHKLGCSIKGLLDLEWPVLKWESEPVRAEDVLVSFTGSNFAIQLLFWHSSLLFIKPFLFVLILFGDKLLLDKGRKFFTSIVIIEEQHLVWGRSSGLCSGLVGWYSSLSSTSQVSISLSIPVSSGNILDSVPALLSDPASALDSVLGSPGGS